MLAVAAAAMAPIKDAVGSSQEALLKLEKSTERNDIQLAEAAQILKLNLFDETASKYSKETIINTANRPAPKDEWVLRWLLKRAKITTYRVQPLSFVLLRKLLQRISRRAIASTFTEYKFAHLLKDVVDDLDSAVFKTLRDGTGQFLSGSETSQTVESSPIRSKKRKRGHDGVEDIEMRDVDHHYVHVEPQAEPAITAYLRFLDALYVLTNLTNDHSDSGNVSQFHLQQSLRLDPALAAQILAKLLRLSAALVVKFAKEKRNDQLLLLLKMTTACFGFWDLQKSGAHRAEKKSINTAFAVSCLLEALRLYRIVLSTGIVSDDVSIIKNSLEKLIALHVVLPARSTFIEGGGSGIDYSKDQDPDWSAVQPVTSNFRPLFEDHSGVDIDCNEMHTDHTRNDTCVFTATWDSAKLIPTFYNIVARSVPRDSFRRQNTEASWLETVFVALAEMAYSSTQPSNDNASGFIPLLEQLFIVVRARKIHLSLHTFLTHAAYTGLLKGKENPSEVRWGLTSILIELGVEIFLPNSGFKDSSRLLDALFQSLQHIRSDIVDKETYQLAKDTVVIPLLQAFAAARALPTFVELWHDQLCQVETDRGSKSSKIPTGAYSVWEDNDLEAAYREASKIALSENHLKTQIEKAISTIITTSGLISDSPESYAHFVILEAGSCAWGHNGLPGLRVDLVTSLVEAIEKSIFSRAKKLHWFWRLWRLTRTFIPISLKSSSNTPNDLAKKFERTALDVIDTKNILKREADPNTWREALEACRFLLQKVKELHHGTGSDSEHTLSKIVQNICSLLGSLVKKEQFTWNGRIQDLDMVSQLGIACAECVLESAHIWPSLTIVDLKQFIDSLSVLAQRFASQEKETSLSPSRHISFEELWSVFTSYGYLVENPFLSSSIAQALCMLLKENVRRNFLLRSLSGIPVRVNEVPGFKNMIKSILFEEDGCPAECVPHVISLINSLCQESQHVEPEFLGWIASGTIPLQGSAADTNTIESFRSLAHMVFECEYKKACKDSIANAQKLLERLHKLANSRVTVAMTELESGPGSKTITLSLTPVFVGVCLRFVWQHHEELADSKVLKDVRRLRGKICKKVLSRLDKCNEFLQRQEDGVDHARVALSLATTLQTLDLFDDVVKEENVAKDHELLVSAGEDVSPALRACLQKITRRQRIDGSATTEGQLGSSDVKLLEGVDLRKMQAFEQQYFARTATAKLRSMSYEERLGTIYELQRLGFEGATGASRLLLAGLAVSVLGDVNEKDSDEARKVSLLCTAMTDVLASFYEIEQFSLAAECLDTILRLHPRGVTQFNIDNCLAMISKTMSRLFVSAEAREISPGFASTIYTRLCRLLGTIVGLYRQQLGGRFHVLIPALQFLLRALFGLSWKRKTMTTTINKNNRAKMTNHEILRTGGSSSILWQALGVPHAVLFTRLLTSLCDPTVSAVSRPNRSGVHAHDGLVDQTKRAKVTAGQHLRILIESYAQNMLEAPLKPDIKAALAPGLYAVLDAMPTESKRGMNAGMDVSSRAIFKTLHEDYVRFGKWNSRG